MKVNYLTISMLIIKNIISYKFTNLNALNTINTIKCFGSVESSCV